MTPATEEQLSLLYSSESVKLSHVYLDKLKFSPTCQSMMSIFLTALSFCKAERIDVRLINEIFTVFQQKFTKKIILDSLRGKSRNLQNNRHTSLLAKLYMSVFEIEKLRKWHYKPCFALYVGHLLFPFWKYCFGVELFIGKGSLCKWIDL